MYVESVHMWLSKTSDFMLSHRSVDRGQSHKPHADSHQAHQALP